MTEVHATATLTACGHPAACLRDGACGWCAAVEDARLHLEAREDLLAELDDAETERDTLAARVDDLEARLVDAIHAREQDESAIPAGVAVLERNAERIVARVAYAERGAAHAALTAAGVDDGHEEGDPPTRYGLPARIGLLVENRDALAAHVERLSAALDRYGRHSYVGWPGVEEGPICGAVYSPARDCDCGLDDALAATPADSLDAVRAAASERDEP